MGKESYILFSISVLGVVTSARESSFECSQICIFFIIFMLLA